MKRLENRIAFVTGGNQGIGAAISKKLAAEGANIAINYFSADSQESAKDVQQQIQDIGQRAIIIEGDVGEKIQVDAMIQYIEEQLGVIDVLVNNAGIAPFESFLNVSEETWDRTYQTNVKSIFLTSQAVVGKMIERRFGKIINIASTASKLVTSPVIPHYISSKAAAHQLTKALAIELGQYNINVNAVGPSTVDSALTKDYLANPEMHQEEVEANPMKRLGTAEQVADAVGFLASDEAEQINGDLLMVDGGLTVKAAQPSGFFDE